MTTWSSNYIEANGLRLHYARTGGAKPPLVLAHGVTDDGLCWTPVAEALAPDYDVIMVDARGHGRSDAPERGYGFAEQADDLAGVIAALKLDQPIVLGHSMGAVTTLVLAGAYPDVPRAILLEDPPAKWLDPDEAGLGDPAWRDSMRAWIAELQRHTRDELIAAQRVEAPGWSAAELEPWAEAKLRFSLNVLNNPTPTAAINWPATLRRITCPALLLTADRAQGAILTDHEAAALQALVPQLYHTSIPQAGHSIHRDQFTRYMEVVHAFLIEVNADA